MSNYSEVQHTDSDDENDQKLIKLVKENPDVFVRFPELLTDIELSHSTGGAISG